MPARPVACALAAFACAAFASCAAPGAPNSDAGPCTVNTLAFTDENAVENTAIRDIDLLLVVDDSGSMAAPQTRLMASIGTLLDELRRPTCTSPTRPEPHPCDPMDPADAPDGRRLDTIHVGVVSSDLGTPGSAVPGCANSDNGDDGLLNPIRYGQALRAHLPTDAPAELRPTDCAAHEPYPGFLAFDSQRAAEPGYATDFLHDVRCNAALGTHGCELQQPLEAAWRALAWHDASDHAGNSDPNSGFLRDHALLALLVLTDQDDRSVRDCRFARGEDCADAIDVFDRSSTRWASTDLNLRFYLAQPGGAQDPTWPIERYVDPNTPMRGFLAVKPGHPERVVFAAVTGVPRALPTRNDGRTDWDALLGAPGANPDDFTTRNGATALRAMSPEGLVSMRSADLDPNCPARVVPACRDEGTVTDPLRPPCTIAEQYFAWPARRIAEVARRFDQARLCNGGACGNGMVASVCDRDWSAFASAFAQRLRRTLVPSCLPRTLPVRHDAAGLETVDCVLAEWTPLDPARPGACDAARGRSASPLVTPREINAQLMQPCLIQQVPTDPAYPGLPMPGVTGWFYQRLPPGLPGSCAQRITFTPDALPPPGALLRYECVAHSPLGCMP